MFEVPLYTRTWDNVTVTSMHQEPVNDLEQDKS